MYSLILMTALSAAPEQPEFNGFFRRLFSFGGSSNGSSCQGNDCYGSSRKTEGCYGSDRNNCYGSRVRAFNPESCSCYGSSSAARMSSGCYGSSLSCQGGMPSAMPEGNFATPSPTMSLAPSRYSELSYSMAPTVVMGEPYILGGAPPGFSVPDRGVGSNPPVEIPDNLTTRRLSGSEQLPNTANRAKVVVRLPADAKLYADGRPLQLTSASREFYTPILPNTQEYQYTFRAEYVRAGETISQSKRVAVKAGGSFNVEFNDLTVAKVSPPTLPDVAGRPNPLPLAALPSTQLPPLVSSGDGPKTVSLPQGDPTIRPLPRPVLPTASNADRARITVKLPPGATLFVDGKKNEREGQMREFTTPPLPAGQEFAYLMKSEIVRNGRPETQATKVTFRAGELVTVDFTAAPAKR